MIEVVIRVVYADGKIDENEVMYLKKMISTLGILPELLEQRFGSIKKLLVYQNKNYSSDSKELNLKFLKIEDLEKFIQGF